MTCLVALTDDDAIYMGADSQVTSWDKQTLAHPKVFRIGKEYLMAGCGYLRGLQAIQYNFQPPLQGGETNMQFMVNTFAESLRSALKSAGVTLVKDNVEHFHGGFLVGYRKTLYSIGGDYAVCQIADKYLTDGSGTKFATGSLYSTEGQPSKERILMALKAAAKYDPFVGPPFTILSIKNVLEKDTAKKKTKTKKGEPQRGKESS